jgi:hypothetical protein
LGRFLFNGFGSYGGGVAGSVAGVQVRGRHAVTAFSHWDTVYVVVSMVCSMLVFLLLIYILYCKLCFYIAAFV